MPIYSVLVLITSMFFSYKDAMSLIPTTIKGVVRDAATHQPIANTYVYIVKGEEESLTNKQGAFAIETWQRLPVWLVIHSGAGRELTFKIAFADKPIQVFVNTE